MPRTPEFARAVEIEQQIRETMDRVFTAQAEGKRTEPLQHKLDVLSEQLLELRLPAKA